MLHVAQRLCIFGQMKNAYFPNSLKRVHLGKCCDLALLKGDVILLQYATRKVGYADSKCYSSVCLRFNLIFVILPPPSARDLLEALLSRLPVDDVPNGLEVLGLAILVLKTGGH